MTNSQMDTANPAPNKNKFRIVQALTLLRPPLAAGFAAVLLVSDPSSSVLVVCAVLLVLLELTDLLDGILARRIGVVSEWGAMLDPYSDSISRITVYWALAYRELAMALVPLVMACRDVTVAYCRVILTRSGRSISAKFSGKMKGQFQAIGGILLLLGPFYWSRTGKWTIHALSWIIIAVTLASVVEYAVAAISASKAAKRGVKSPREEH